jgi:hypothetical protein
VTRSAHGRYHSLRSDDGTLHRATDATCPEEPEYRVLADPPLPSWTFDSVEIDLQARIDAMFAPEKLP